MLTVNNIATDAGCYIAGHHGQYAIDALGDLVEQFGFEFGTVDGPDVEDDPRYWRAASEAENMEDAAIISSGGFQRVATPEECMEEQIGAGDRLEAILNEHTSGGYWTWQDGEFFLVQSEVDGWIYIVAKDYEEAWEILRDAGSEAGYCELEPALDAAGYEEDTKVFQFHITIHYARED